MKACETSGNAYWNYERIPAAQLGSEYLALLDGNPSEQEIQRYIEDNTRLVPREFVQNHGIHFQLVLRKLSFGADFKSDLGYLSKSSDDWNCVLIELEHPASRFFNGKTNDFHPDFLKAVQQIDKWRAWLLRLENRATFADNTLGPIRKPLGRNPVYMKFVLVHGRRAEYRNNEQRRALIAAKEADDFKIMTFDSLAENLQSKHDLYVAARRNEYIDVLSDVFLDESMFAWMQPEQIRISEKLKASALAAKPHWFHVRHFDTKDDNAFVMPRALRDVRIRR